MNNTHNTRICAKSPRRNSRGFSTLEILVATVLIGTLVAGGIYYANIGQKVNAVEFVSIKTAVVVRFPEAIATIYSNRQTLENTDVNALTGTGSVQANAPVAWEVSTTDQPTKTTISLIFTLATDSEATDLESYLDGNLDTTLVSEVDIDEDDDTKVIVKYEIS